jgi:hypothetical protein
MLVLKCTSATQLEACDIIIEFHCNSTASSKSNITTPATNPNQATTRKLHVLLIHHLSRWATQDQHTRIDKFLAATPHPASQAALFILIDRGNPKLASQTQAGLEHLSNHLLTKEITTHVRMPTIVPLSAPSDLLTYLTSYAVGVAAGIAAQPELDWPYDSAAPHPSSPHADEMKNSALAEHVLNNVLPYATAGPAPLSRASVAAISQTVDSLRGLALVARAQLRAMERGEEDPVWARLAEKVGADVARDMIAFWGVEWVAE